MKIYEKIRALREEKKWSQEEFAAKLGLSANGYAKIERGETRLNIPRLEQIAELFGIDILELIQNNDNSTFYQVNNESDYCVNIALGENQALLAEIDKLNLSLVHQSEMLAQKDRELDALKEIIRLMKATQTTSAE